MSGTGNDICIHGHFYQPPRGNPWTGIVEREASAGPWHDWNDRICDECYRPNTAARILDAQGRIGTAISTYSRISCDFGPTLLAWLERERPAVYEALLESDRQGRGRFSGHGTAIAHPYHHSILPLLPLRDKRTEIRWGIRDFEDRFGRYPEGLWLPEMAVDRETLEVLADHDIRFTILAPHQIKRMRVSPDENWTGGGGAAAPRHPGTCRLSSGREITIFFHDAGIAKEIAFGNLLENGDVFADRLLSAAAGEGLVHTATDGETFGHHRAFGEMALAWCISRLETPPARLTVYGEYLATHPPSREVEIHEQTSWSCPHGISRWGDGCECASGRHEGWQHAWRGPLHGAIVRLTEMLMEVYVREGGSLFSDPWAAREDCIGLLRTPSVPLLREFVKAHARKDLSGESLHRALALLELSRQVLAMQTSCAFYFDDIADREAVQVLRHAARAIQICRDRFGTDTEPWFLRVLSGIHGNRPRLPDGAAVYRTCVLPLVISARQQVACQVVQDVRSKRSSITSTRPGTGEWITCGEVRHPGDLTLSHCRIRYCFMAAEPDTMYLGVTTEDGVLNPDASAEIVSLFRTRGYAEALKALSRVCTIRTMPDMPPPGKKAVIRLQLHRMQDAVDISAGIVFDRYADLVRDGQDLHGLEPAVSRLAGSVLTYRMRILLSDPASLPRDLRELTGTCSRWGVLPEAAEVRAAAAQFVQRLADAWSAAPEEGERIDRLLEALALIGGLAVHLDLWNLQNDFLRVRDGPVWQERRQAMDPGVTAWNERFRTLGRVLGVRCD